MTEITAGTWKRDATVIGLVSGGHFMSHFYSTVLPPLFPFLHMELGVSYMMLGLLLSAKNLTTGAVQLPAGILVDRYGAKLLLLFGFGIMTAAFFFIALSHAFWLIALLILIAGIGNSVFHPADYSILNGSIHASRIGRSFSVHTFSGNLGDALAPVMILTAATLWNWRIGLIGACIVSAIILFGMITQWNRIEEQDAALAQGRPSTPSDAPKKTVEEASGSDGVWASLRAVVTYPPMLLLFLFFSISALGAGAFRNWSVAGLHTLHGTPVAVAGAALTGFLFASAFGVLAGGVVADKNSRHELIAGGALLLTALIAVIVGSFPLPIVALVGLFILAGWVQGMIRPARDMMIRAASPKGSIGKAFGFVFSGQAVGGTIAPVLFGFLIDIGATAWLFYTAAVFMVLCTMTVVASASLARKQQQDAATR